MSREGLVQRKTAAQASGGAAAKDDDDDTHRPLDDDKDDDDDGKSTRLTLMEEVLLLGLKDREACFIFGLCNDMLFGFGALLYFIICLMSVPLSSVGTLYRSRIVIV